jgi:Domain of unknown function (DUF4136)
MKKITVFFLCLAFVGCSTIKTSYDYDKQADFTKYKTYSYSDEALKMPIQELNRNRVLEAIDAEMTARGYTKSDNPDAIVDVDLKAEKKQEATATTTGGYGGYGRYRGYGYGGGFSTTQINVNEYVEGTLFISLVDKQTNKLFWQGRGTKVLDEDATPERRDANIKYAVGEIFKNYPAKK